MRLYWEDKHTPETDKPQGPTTVPLALAAFAYDFSGIKRFAHRDHANIVSWTEFDRGGHYPAHEVPELLVGDLRRFTDRTPLLHQTRSRCGWSPSE